MRLLAVLLLALSTGCIYNVAGLAWFDPCAQCEEQDEDPCDRSGD